MLFRAENVAGTADLQVAHCDLKSRAELGIFADRLQTLRRNFGQHLALRISEVCISTARRTPDASADLMQLG